MVVEDKSEFLQHLPGLLRLAERGFLVVEGALISSVNFTVILSDSQRPRAPGVATPRPNAEGRAAAALRLPGAALQALAERVALEARFAGASQGRAAAVAPAGAPEAAAAAPDAVPASSIPPDSHSAKLHSFVSNAITCLLNSCMIAGGVEHVTAQCGPGLLSPEVLRRLVSVSEGPPNLASHQVAGRLQLEVVLARSRANLLLSLTHGAEAGFATQAPPLLVALRRGAGDEALDFALVGIRNALAPEPATAAGGASAETRARKAAVAAVSGAQDSGLPHQVSCPISTWVGLLCRIVCIASGQPDDESVRIRLLRRAVDGGAALLVLTALEAAALVSVPEGADSYNHHTDVGNCLMLLCALTKGNQRCWQEAVFEQAPPDSAIRARRPAWATASGESASGRAPLWAVSVAVGVLKRAAARQRLQDQAWFVSEEDSTGAAVVYLLGFFSELFNSQSRPLFFFGEKRFYRQTTQLYPLIFLL